jgi:hypothetical protein
MDEFLFLSGSMAIAVCQRISQSYCFIAWPRMRYANYIRIHLLLLVCHRKFKLFLLYMLIHTSHGHYVRDEENKRADITTL